MGKRVAITIAICLILVLLILGFFLQQGRKNLLTDPYKPIPQDACIVIETVDIKSFLNSLTTGRGLFGELGKVRELGKFNSSLKFLADLVNRQSLKNLFNDKSTVISFHPDIQGKLCPLFSMPVSGDISLRHIREMMAAAGVTGITETKIGHSVIAGIPYQLNNKQDTAYYALLNGLLICSNTKGLILEASDQPSKGNDIRQVAGFTRVQVASGKNVDKLFIVPPNLQGTLQRVFNSNNRSLADKIAKLARTAAGDIYISEDGVIINGYTESADSSDLLFNYKSLPSREFHTTKILPSSTVLFETLVVPSMKLHETSDTSVTSEAYALARLLKQFMGEEFTRSIIDIKGNSPEENSLLIYELSNREEAEKIFLEQKDAISEILYFQPDEQIKLPVYKASFKGLIKVYLPGFARGMNETYFTFYDHYMISGNSFNSVSRLLYDNILNKTLLNDLSFRDFDNTLPSRAGYYFYCIPSRITDFLGEFLNEEIAGALLSNSGSLIKIQAAGYKFSSSNGMLYNSLSIKYKEEAREESKTEWETLLDTVAAIKPFFFTNHITGAKEIFIQDMKNNTYLINAAGRVLWKVPLNERIVSNIFMVDYFRNGKYQLLFSGKNYIHLLDRNGNYVERYPVRLRSPATNSMTVFDYDNNMNYRLFVAGEDHLIYSYDKTGSAVKGWTPYRTPGRITAEINYFKVSGRDYIVAADETSIYFLDRSGKKRMTLNQPVTKAPGSTMRLNLSLEPSLICTAPDGTVQSIYFDGTVRKFSFRKFSDHHLFDFFDVDGDSFGEYIFIDKGILYLYNHNREEIFKKEFGSDELGGPINFTFSSADRKIGVFDIKKNLIYLIGYNGKVVNGFPLKGASMFSIGKLSDKSGWHLIVGGTDRFLYNYKIETEVK